MKNIFKYALGVAFGFLLGFLFGYELAPPLKQIKKALGVSYEPDIPRLQADGEILVAAVRKYEEVHGRLPRNQYELLADDKNIPFDARNLLLNADWRYSERHPDTFIVYKYTGHLADVLVYEMATDENGKRQYRWTVTSWK